MLIDVHFTKFVFAEDSDAHLREFRTMCSEQSLLCEGTSLVVRFVDTD